MQRAGLINSYGLNVGCYPGGVLKNTASEINTSITKVVKDKAANNKNSKNTKKGKKRR